MTRPQPFSLALAALAALGLAACDTAPPPADTVTSSLTPPPLATGLALPARPENAAPGTCWDKTVTPATIETVNTRVLVTPAQLGPDGTIQSPPVYRNDTRQSVVTPRQANWIQILCPADLTPDFVASLQRALQARGLYAGPITGALDPPTRSAITALQAQTGQGGDSLSIATARSLGLWTVARDAPPAPATDATTSSVTPDSAHAAAVPTAAAETSAPATSLPDIPPNPGAVPPEAS